MTTTTSSSDETLRTYPTRADCNGEGYWQDTIKGIYQNAKADANKALEEAKANEPEDGDYRLCQLDGALVWITVHDLIQ